MNPSKELKKKYKERTKEIKGYDLLIPEIKQFGYDFYMLGVSDYQDIIKEELKRKNEHTERIEKE